MRDTVLLLKKYPCIMNVKESDWFYSILTKPENEIVKMIKRNPALIKRPLQFSCEMRYYKRKNIYMACNCGVTLETLKGEIPFNEMMNELTTYLDNGHCIHAPMNKVESLRRENTAPQEMPDVIRKDATTFLIHVATALGKEKIVKHIIRSVTCTMHEHWPMFDEKYQTNILLLSPLHLALFHERIDIFKLIAKRCSYSLPVTSYYIEKDPELTIRKETCLAIAAGLNAKKFVEVILQCDSSVLRDSDYCEGFCNAINKRSHECAEILVKRIRNFSVTCNNYLHFADVVFKQDDARLLKILLSLKGVNVSVFLQRLIYHGNVQLISMALKSTEREKFQIHIPGIPFLIQAVLHNSALGILKILMVHCEADCSRCYKGYSALDWARALGYVESERVIESKGIEFNKFNTDIVRLYPPLLAVFDFEEIDINLNTCVTRLISEGEDVNACLMNGVTPFVRATEIYDIQKYPIIRTLLMNGADPFKGVAFKGIRVSFPAVTEDRLIVELLYCNIDVCQKDYNVNHLLKSASQFGLYLIFKFAHTIPPKYMEFFTLHIYPSMSKDKRYVRKGIEDILHNPRNLMVICRNSLRRYYGIQIHAFVNSECIPCKIKNFLTLKDQLCRNI